MQTLLAGLLVAFVLVGGSSSETFAGTRARYWRNFKSTFPKLYETPLEEANRENIFWQSLETISRHNYEFRRGRKTFRMGINQFTDMPFEEFAAMYTLNDSLASVLKEKVKNLKFQPIQVFTDKKFKGVLPESLDWRQRGAVTAVEDQRHCGSCYAFSALAAVESHYFIHRGELPDLSVQEILDCPEDSYMTFKCSGGTVFKVFDYVRDHGVSSKVAYPYEGKIGQCRKRESLIKGEVRGYGYVDANDNDQAMEKALVDIGPIAIAMNIKYETFMRYSGGIYFEDCEGKINHGVLLVGYGTENGQDYWIIKNSFGDKWGENGFFRLARGKGDTCGIFQAPIYPVMKKKIKTILPIRIPEGFDIRKNLVELRGE